MFTRDRLFIDDATVMSSINMPYDFIPKYTNEEVQEKMRLIPSLIPLNYNATVKQFIDFFAYRRRGLMAS
jgi:hypothetical protein